MKTKLLWQTRSTDAYDTQRIGAALGSLLKAPVVIELRSDLGGGKTTFVRGLVKGLGSKDRAASPTFTLSRIYKAPGLEIHHFDFYRLDEPGVVSDQLEESLQNSRVITLVEWSDIVEKVLPEERLTIVFNPVQTNPDERLIQISYPASKEAVIKSLETLLAEPEA